MKLSERLFVVETKFSEREINWNRLWTAVLTLIGLGVIQTCTLIYWLGETNNRMRNFEAEDRRMGEILFRIEHPNQPTPKTP